MAKSKAEQRRNSKGERAAAARASATGGYTIVNSSSPAPGPLQLQREDSNGTVTKISRALRKKRPDLGEDPSDDASAAYLAASFIAYASEKSPQTETQWSDVLAEVLADARTPLDEDENDAAIRGVIADLISKGVLVVVAPQLEVGAMVLALLDEDEDWHEAVVEEAIGSGVFRVVFLEYGKSQDTPAGNIRRHDSIVEDEGTEDMVQDGDCELCQRHLLLTFHHLIPKDTHPTYLKRPGQLASIGIEGEPSRGFLNTYGTMVCRQCHSHIHSLASNDALAREYNTLQKILDHPKIQRWVEWASKQRSGKWAN